MGNNGIDILMLEILDVFDIDIVEILMSRNQEFEYQERPISNFKNSKFYVRNNSWDLGKGLGGN